MELPEALEVLGLASPTTLGEARTAYRRLVRQRHPDLAAPAAPTPLAAERSARTGATARLNEAWRVVQREAVRAGAERIDAAPPAPPTPPPAAPGTPDADAAVAALDGETLAVAAPADLTYAWLYEAAGRVGEVSYYDRHLGLLEIIVRFEGGPSCSVLMTLQGRAMHTEVFCTMESIEAAPTPSLRPVVVALAEELAAVARGD
ncbi:MAG: hypothetical protein MUF83_11155 [Acidimicrobiales bacterium]|jgi:hypothetical protein|nr:hypothetical protein [Acidimicrobiales bacterium]